VSLTQRERQVIDLIGEGFFISSRRRHTNSDRDWSSDVCSSDLLGQRQAGREALNALCPMPSRLPAERYSGRSWKPATQEQNQKGDRKSTRLNSSHDQISYAVFCLKKKKKKN